MTNAHGGARSGSGPKPKKQKFEGEITRADKRIAKNLVRYIENLEALADGVTVQEVDKDGNERIYTRAPDRQANEYLLNRIMGKPTERQEHEVSGPGGGAIPVSEIRVNLKHYESLGD